MISFPEGDTAGLGVGRVDALRDFICEFLTHDTNDLHQLNEVSAGIIKDGHPHRSSIRRPLGELNANIVEPLELGIYLIDRNEVSGIPSSTSAFL